MKSLFKEKEIAQHQLNDRGYDALVEDKELHEICRVYVLDYFPDIISDENKMSAMKEICKYSGIVFKNKINDGIAKDRKISFKNELRAIENRSDYKLHMISVANIILKYKNN